MVKRDMTWFTDYWDDVIRRWFDEEIESRQRLFLDTTHLGVSRLHMPEPYWGDPENCSIVIAHYNPGGGADRDRNTYRDCAYCPGSFINQVKHSKYSTVAKSFPIIGNGAFSWCNEYGGSKWWKQKVKWLKEYILYALNDETGNNSNIAQSDSQNTYSKDNNELNPFALEFCGWHSPSWNVNISTLLKNNSSLFEYTERFFLKPLVDAIHNSTSQIGVCVGAQFYDYFKKLPNTIECVYKTSSPNYFIHLFKYDGSRILVVWGKNRNRRPKIDPNDLNTLL